MANVLGDIAPTIFIGSTAKTLPAIEQGGRTENFIKESKTWVDFDGEIRERVRGYRLRCRYVFGRMEGADIDTILEIFNSSEQIFIRFSNLTHKRFPVIVSNDLEHDLWAGYTDFDQVVLEFEGKFLEKYFPNADIAFAMPGVFNGFALIAQ